MPESLRSRLLALVALGVLGVGLAGAGTAFGVTAPLAGTGSPAEFVVTDGNVTLTTGEGSATLVENMSDVRAVTIEETGDGEFTVHTQEARPLTEDERERARSIALANDTVRRELDAMPAHDLSVEPVRKLNLSASESISVDTADLDADSGEFTVRSADDSDGGAVTIVRDPSYVENRAVVRVRQPGVPDPRDLKYTVDVNLTSGTVTGITDWDAIRGGSASTVQSHELNATTISLDGS